MSYIYIVSHIYVVRNSIYVSAGIVAGLDKQNGPHKTSMEIRQWSKEDFQTLHYAFAVIMITITSILAKYKVEMICQYMDVNKSNLCKKNGFLKVS